VDALSMPGGTSSVDDCLFDGNAARRGRRRRRREHDHDHGQRLHGELGLGRRAGCSRPLPGVLTVRDSTFDT
jgi:hypothetical protein